VSMPPITVPAGPLPLRPEIVAEVERAWRRHGEALRRVNQDWTVFGAVERTNADRLDRARRELTTLGVSWGGR
jgi:hypothetical protein